MFSERFFFSEKSDSPHERAHSPSSQAPGMILDPSGWSKSVLGKTKNNLFLRDPGAPPPQVFDYWELFNKKMLTNA